MVDQRSKHLFGSVQVPQVSNDQTLPGQPSNATSAIPPSDFSSVFQFLPGQIIQLAIPNLLSNFCPPRVESLRRARAHPPRLGIKLLQPLSSLFQKNNRSRGVAAENPGFSSRGVSVFLNLLQ